VLGIEWVRPGLLSRTHRLTTPSCVSAAVLSGYFLVAVSYVWENEPRTARGMVALAAMAGIFVCQLCASFPRFRPTGRHTRLGLFAVQALLTYLPFLRLYQSWLCTLGFLAGSALLVLPELSSLPVFLTVVLSTDGLEYWAGVRNMAEVVATTVTTAVTGLVLFGQSRLVAELAEMQRCRAEAARLAVEQERRRFSQDLHDLLGYSLSTITLKCALAQRVLPPESSRAERELTEVQQLSRQVLADVRTVSHGYRRLSLAAESEAAERLLTQAGVSVRTHVDCPHLPWEADTVLSTVLRESVTNMVRHARLRHCTVEAVRTEDRVRLTIANDGVRANPLAGRVAGCGLSNLRARVEERGGRFGVRARPDGWFELTAELDLVPVPHEV
jgi:two-component system sensor histidine kinase DesK